ncbi:MAG: serine hydrolase [Hyphomicrobium sp.]
MFRRRATAAWAAASLLSVFATAAFAAGSKHAAMMLDANSGEVLHNEDGDALRHPASLTKMMTLYLTFETIESGRLTMTTRIPISETAANAAPSKLDLEPGDDIAVGDAIRALITKSANDVAIALAEKIGGSERNFVKLMNQRARDLGMAKTNFENSSGLPDADQVTTARDMITLGLRLQDDFPEHYRLFASRSFTYAGKTLRNHNTLLNSYQGADGIKTGYTRMSGFNLVSSVRRGGRHVVGAVFGGQSAATRNGEMRILLSKGLAKASTIKTRKPTGPLIAKLKSPPKVAGRPALKPSIVAEAPRPTLEKRPEPKPFAPPRETVAAVPAVEPAAAPIEVYKVKRIVVAARPKPIDPDTTTDMTMEELVALATSDAAVIEAKPLFVTASVAAAPGEALAQRFSVAAAEKETVVGKVNPDPNDSAALSKLGAADVAPPAPTPPPASAATPPFAVELPSQSLPGLAPSTLAAQAAALGDTRQRVASLATAPAAKPALKGGTYEIQIGAYGSVDEAKRALADVRTRAASLIGSAEPVTQPVQKSGRTMYRARFAGFGAGAAQRACSDLRRQSIDCIAMSGE